MHYLLGAMKRENNERDYRIYVTDMLNNILNVLTHEAVRIPRWYDQVYLHKDRQVKQNKSADDIVSDFVKRGGLVITNEST